MKNKRKGKEIASDPSDEDDDHDASHSSDDEESESDENSTVNVDFEFFDPKPEDYHGVKLLLQNYLDDCEWDIAGFVNLILGQTRVGTIVKAGGDDPIGLITALNIRRYKELPSIQAIRDFLVKRAKNSPELSKLQALWQSDKNVGLLVSQRLMNVPLELCPPLHDAIFDEIAWATEDESSAELRESFKFQQYLIQTRVYKEKVPKKQPVNEDGNFIFIKPEDELFFQLSSWHFTFPVQAETMLAHQTKGLQLLGLVMAVSAKQIKAFRSKLKGLVC
ncbi:hypothetical protein SELMODRAFT_426584 [Selaginella moellendorffii]|uniref:Protein BCCIP homolog n=1 Tax=Selaginella moellendorffii TaxID=88036 RepID=D8SWU9_SELML|nr:hypothetical protein SELMODRAFT_426584 [Selaginella moellendorffii]